MNLVLALRFCLFYPFLCSLDVFLFVYFILLRKWAFYEEFNLPHVDLHFTLKFFVCQKEAEQDFVIFKHALACLGLEDLSEL